MVFRKNGVLPDAHPEIPDSAFSGWNMQGDERLQSKTVFSVVPDHALRERLAGTQRHRVPDIRLEPGGDFVNT